MSATPRTDEALHAVHYGTARYSFPEHARTLERELAAARAEIARLNGQTRWQCACGGTYCAGQMENQQLRKEVAGLRAALELGQINCEAVYSDMQDDRERVMAELAKLRKDVQFVIDHAGRTVESEVGELKCGALWMAEQLGAALGATEDRKP